MWAPNQDGPTGMALQPEDAVDRGEVAEQHRDGFDGADLQTRRRTEPGRLTPDRGVAHPAGEVTGEAPGW